MLEIRHLPEGIHNQFKAATIDTQWLQHLLADRNYHRSIRFEFQKIIFITKGKEAA